MIRFITITVCAALLSGCAILSGTTPVTGTSIMRAATDGSGRLRPGDTVSIDEAWAEGVVDLVLEEEYFDPAHTGLEIDSMKRRKVTIRRESHPSIAGDVAAARAEAAGRATADLFDLLAAAAPIVTQGFVEYRQTQEENRTLRRLYELQEETLRQQAGRDHEGEP